MKGVRRILYILVVCSLGLSLASVTAGDKPYSPKPGTPADNECNPGGVLYREQNQDGCPTPWYWKAGWYLARYLRGIYSREDIPAEFQTVLPPPESTPVPSATRAITRPTATPQQPQQPTAQPPTPRPPAHISVTVERLQASSADICNQEMDFFGGLFLYWDGDSDPEAGKNFGVHQGNDIAPNWELGGDISGSVTEFAAAIVVKDEDDLVCGGGDDDVDLNPYSDATDVMVKVSVPAGEVWLVTERSSIFLGFVGQSLEVGPGTNAREWGKVTFRVDVTY